MLKWLVDEMKRKRGDTAGPPLELDDWSTDAGSESLPLKGVRRFRHAAHRVMGRMEEEHARAAADGAGLSVSLVEGAWEALLEYLGSADGNDRLLHICATAEENWAEGVDMLSGLLEAGRPAATATTF